MSYRNVDTGVWSDPDFRRSSDTGKLMFLYLLTNEHTNVAGCYRLPLDTIAHELRDRENGESEEDSMKKVKCILDEPTKLYEYDFTTEQVFIPNFLKYNTAKSPSQLKGISVAIRSLSWCPMLLKLYFSIIRYGAEKVFELTDSSVNKYVSVQAGIEKNTPQGVVVSEVLNKYLDK